MPRQRRLVPITPFGIWLDQWLTDNPEWTYEAFGAEVGVTKTSITNWVGAQKPVKIPVHRLRRIAKVTNADVAFLEQLVYGVSNAARVGDTLTVLDMATVTKTIQETIRAETPVELDPLVLATIERAVDRAFDRFADRLIERLAPLLEQRRGDA